MGHWISSRRLLGGGTLGLAVAALSAGGCGTSGVAAESRLDRAAYASAPAAMESQDAVGLASLFKPDASGTMSDQAIVQVLGAKVYPPAHGRLAVLRFGQVYGNWATEEQATLELATTDDLLKKLRSSPRLSDAVVLPSLLAPPQMTIPYLRESAARLQADSLLVYRTGRRNFQRSRAFAPDQIRAYCTVEAVLLDVRTGIVTDTAVATESFSASKSSKDLSFEETVARAEREAVGKALDRVATDLVNYLNTAPMADSLAPADTGEVKSEVKGERERAGIPTERSNGGSGEKR